MILMAIGNRNSINGDSNTKLGAIRVNKFDGNLSAETTYRIFIFGSVKNSGHGYHTIDGILPNKLVTSRFSRKFCFTDSLSVLT